MDALFFAVKYIPFWSIPSIFIAGPFAYLFWIKDIPRLQYICMLVTFLNTLFVIYWIWAGGPNKSVRFIIDVINQL